MTLKDRITEDMKAAMRAKDAERLLHHPPAARRDEAEEVDERIELDDAAVVAIVDKLVKQRKDSIAAVHAGGRQDLADKESAEIAVLEAYLPAAPRRRRDRGRGRRPSSPSSAPAAPATWAR